MSILKLFEYTFSTLGFAEEAIEKVQVKRLLEILDWACGENFEEQYSVYYP